MNEAMKQKIRESLAGSPGSKIEEEVESGEYYGLHYSWDSAGVRINGYALIRDGKCVARDKGISERPLSQWIGERKAAGTIG